jgi:flavin reductase (DIM6/NTAB) family NADH-FMN oxidoreductase RutF
MKYFTVHIPKEDTYQVISNLADHSPLKINELEDYKYLLFRAR